MMVVWLTGCFWTEPLPPGLFTDPDAAFPIETGTPPEPVGNSVELRVLPATIVGTVPAPGATDVDPTLTQIEVQFNEVMLRMYPNVSSEQDLLGAMPVVTYPDDQTALVEVTLQPATTYRLWINEPGQVDPFNGFQDVSGALVEGYSLAFSTVGGSPDPYAGIEGAVVSSDPVAGTSFVDPDRDAITVTFSKDVELTTVVVTPWRDDVALPPSTPELDAPNVVRLPVTLEPSTTYGFSIVADDTEGIAFPPYEVAFRTSAGL